MLSATFETQQRLGAEVSNRIAQWEARVGTVEGAVQSTKDHLTRLASQIATSAAGTADEMVSAIRRDADSGLRELGVTVAELAERLAALEVHAQGQERESPNPANAFLARSEWGPQYRALQDRLEALEEMATGLKDRLAQAIKKGEVRQLEQKGLMEALQDKVQRLQSWAGTQTAGSTVAVPPAGPSETEIGLQADLRAVCQQLG